MAHLSYQRPAPSNPWDYEAIWSDLSGVIRDFIDSASPGRLGEAFVTRVRQILDAPVQEPAAVRLPDLHASATNWVPSEIAGSAAPGTATAPIAYPFSGDDAATHE